MTLTLPYKILVVLVLSGGIYLAGYITGRKYTMTASTSSEKKVDDNRIAVSEGKTQIVYRDRIVEHETIKYPDGTQVTKDTTTQENTKQQDQNNVVEKEKKKEEQKVVTVIQSATPSQYRLGVKEHLNYERLLPTSAQLEHNAEVTGAYRLAGPLWLECGYQPATKDVSLGLSVEF